MIVKSTLTKFLSYIIIILLAIGCKKGVKLEEQLMPFYDDFESGSEKWELHTSRIRIINSGNAEHKNVLALTPGGDNVYALIKGSALQTNYEIQGDVFFPEYEHNYLGFIYNYNLRDVRVDYGCIYIKGNGSYVRVNPHRDSNVSRVLYNELRSNLTGSDSIITGQWQHFKAEVVGSVCHFYVGDMITPKVIYKYFEFDKGKIGFEPRIIGSSCWIDNISLTPITSLSFKGEIPLDLPYQTDQMITQWKAIGAFKRPNEILENDSFNSEMTYSENNQTYKWIDFEADSRGCTITGRIFEYPTQKRYLYLYKNITADSSSSITLNFSTTNELVIWANGIEVGTVEASTHANHDFMENEKHKGSSISVNLKEGGNDLLIRARSVGLDYTGDGFYLVVN